MKSLAPGHGRSELASLLNAVEDGERMDGWIS